MGMRNSTLGKTEGSGLEVAGLSNFGSLTSKDTGGDEGTLLRGALSSATNLGCGGALTNAETWLAMVNGVDEQPSSSPSSYFVNGFGVQMTTHCRSESA